MKDYVYDITSEEVFLNYTTSTTLMDDTIIEYEYFENE